MDADAKQIGKMWGQLERLAQIRDDWRKLVGTKGEDEMRLNVSCSVKIGQDAYS
ncbi:hypothetical protein DPMN_165693 [Dreissena polymorpha]|uniref:Uncharacterized protein n=1 Tax=Dreissena polymorpha TaxID=45954 RepID=A0A9D4IWV7_DREPO|nr:hypothetical protein DPMN_165693 [Dreissena polymorpha]